jgi:hypothetical protein
MKTDPSDTVGMYSGRIFYRHIAPIMIILVLTMKKVVFKNSINIQWTNHIMIFTMAFS